MNGNPIIVLLSGIPATGKTSFGKWLEEQKGFLHIDRENDIQWKDCYRKAALETALQSSGPDCFIKKAHKIGKPIALDWGFPPCALPIVRELQSSGAVPWWFNGGRKIARSKFVERGGGIGLNCFDIQMNAIEQHWHDISDIFNTRIIETLRSDGSYLEPELIYEIMFPNSPGSLKDE